MYTYDGNPLRLGFLMKQLRLGLHCRNCKSAEATWSLISRPEERRMSSSSIQINISCCALDSVTLVDVQSLLVKPHWRIPACRTCLPEFWITEMLESLRITENTTSQGSNESPETYS